CVFSGCNHPKIADRLPYALETHIPDNILDQYLDGVSNYQCWDCAKCVNDTVGIDNMSGCTKQYCLTNACSLVVSRNTNNPTCPYTMRSKCYDLGYPPIHVNMTLVYYYNSDKKVIYTMDVICHKDNCNDYSTYKALENALSVNPDLACLDIGESTLATAMTAGTGTTRTPGTGTTATAGTGTTRTPGTGTTTSGTKKISHYTNMWLITSIFAPILWIRIRD
ncbi:unnamed protein product, partial [Didymodactylos carnosus]